MATELKIHLATYLKDAGIKATSQQVDQLAEKVKRVNNDVSSGADRAAGALGKLPGPLGKIQGVIGGVGGTAMAVIGAFKVGWDIGMWLQEHVIAPLFDIKDPIEELKKHNREVERQWKQMMETWHEQVEEWEQGWAKNIKGAEDAKTKVDELTQAYLKMQAARERGALANDSAEVIAAKRAKFEDMLAAGTPEEAAARGKLHDVELAELQAKQQLAKFDRDAVVETEKLARAREALNDATNKESMQKRELQELDKKIAYWESQASVNKYGFENSVKEERQLKAKREQLQAQLENTQKDVRRRKADIDAAKEAVKSLPQERQNMQARAELEIDERKKAYDDYVQEVTAREAQAAEEWAQKQAETMRRAVEQEQRERERMERELAQQRLADLRNELQTELRERQQAESAARSRSSAADSALTTAWGWYRDQQSMQAVIDEHKAQAAAEVQWQKDFDRLKTYRRDWRTVEFGKLSAADEAVRQVALAKEEKAAADRAVIETAENTRELAEKLDELLSVKG